MHLVAVGRSRRRALVALGLVAGVLVAIGLEWQASVSRHRNAVLQDWDHRLSSMAEDRVAAIEMWLQHNEGDARAIAAFPAVSALPRAALAPGGPEPALLAKATAAVEGFQRAHGVAGVSVFDA